MFVTKDGSVECDGFFLLPTMYLVSGYDLVGDLKLVYGVIILAIEEVHYILYVSIRR